MRELKLVLTVSITLAMMGIMGCGDKDKVTGSEDEEHVVILMVKNGHFSSHPAPEKSIGQATTAFFGNPEWTAFEGTDGYFYVNLSGTMRYKDERVNALIQFRVDKTAGSFEMNAFEIDGDPQSILMRLALIDVMYE